MAISPVRGKSWGGLHDWLPAAQLTKHQGGRKGSIGQPTRHQGGTRKVGKNHLDSLGGTREARKNQLNSLRGTRAALGRQEKNHHQGGTRETRRTGLPIKSRFWKRFMRSSHYASIADPPSIARPTLGSRHSVGLSRQNDSPQTDDAAPAESDAASLMLFAHLCRHLVKSACYQLSRYAARMFVQLNPVFVGAASIQ